MTCDITASGKCEREEDQKYQCYDCSAFLTLCTPLLNNPHFIRVSAPISGDTGIIKNNNGQIVMQIRSGKFTKGS